MTDTGDIIGGVIGLGIGLAVVDAMGRRIKPLTPYKRKAKKKKKR